MKERARDELYTSLAELGQMKEGNAETHRQAVREILETCHMTYKTALPSAEKKKGSKNNGETWVHHALYILCLIAMDKNDAA